MILYPTAIGDEPQDKTLDSKDHWQMTMRGHAAANMIPVVASNRIGSETSDSATLTFYGSSFIAGSNGELVAEAPRDKQMVITATFDLDALRAARASSGFFRDRRVDLYRKLLTVDGTTLPV
jgi:N-carbamoylputrescine amidase